MIPVEGLGFYCLHSRYQMNIAPNTIDPWYIVFISDVKVRHLAGITARVKPDHVTQSTQSMLSLELV